MKESFLKSFCSQYIFTVELKVTKLVKAMNSYLRTERTG